MGTTAGNDIAGTLSDRMLEMTGTIRRPAAPDPNKLATDDAKNEQVLDTLKVERERGITVRRRNFISQIAPPPRPLPFSECRQEGYPAYRGLILSCGFQPGPSPERHDGV